MSERCPTCDRVGCLASRITVAVNDYADASGMDDDDAWNRISTLSDAAHRDCRANSVDWRSRCQAAESTIARQAEEIAGLKAERDTALAQVASLTEDRDRQKGLIRELATERDALRRQAAHKSIENKSDTLEWQATATRLEAEVERLRAALTKGAEAVREAVPWRIDAIAELRTLAAAPAASELVKHWPDCAINHGGPECDMGPECGDPPKPSEEGP